MVEQLPPSHLKSKRQIKIWKQQQNDNTAKRQKADSYTSQDPFRYSERNFKSRIIPTDIMAQVVDTSQLLDSNFSPSLQQQHGIRHVTLATDLRFERPDIFGLVDESWKRRSLDAFVITQIPGLIIIPNPFTPKAQRRLIQLCLTDYTLPPNTSNLDAHYDRPKKGIWDLYQREYEGLLTAEDKEYYVPSKANDKQLGNNNLYGNNGDDTATNRTPLLPPSDLLRKQRWITLGYQYDWKTKLYDLENGLPMPEELNDLAKAVVSAAEGIGYSNDEHSSSESTTSWKNTYRGSTFKAEAGVINYYQLRDTLMAHVDKSEVNMEAPIVSVR
ncbi:uncharacterized protein BX664DRAFT_265199 [Halteromyces radiatus]|uniref:uncharacterized protein n=1 Tax=Halteromyces radiatus TaxID=101107 RepID=UPI00221F5182|nr:uncharacterized protein BX664DRAFT_265199 [Halteromyces radiatus]KAI8086047.1 hypothetical protein BX664DRAFT_265199 [Halteromyces radiatus]